jgi:hypothetical protein
MGWPAAGLSIPPLVFYEYSQIMNTVKKIKIEDGEGNLLAEIEVVDVFPKSVLCKGDLNPIFESSERLKEAVNLMTR